MASIFRVYSGDDGQSHVEEMALDMQPFTDTEGAHGEGTALLNAKGITFRRLITNWAGTVHRGGNIRSLCLAERKLRSVTAPKSEPSRVTWCWQRI